LILKGFFTEADPYVGAAESTQTCRDQKPVVGRVVYDCHAGDEEHNHCPNAGDQGFVFVDGF